MDPDFAPNGEKIVWVPYVIHSPTKKPSLVARHAIPLNMDRYEIGFGVYDPSTAATTSTTPPTMSTSSTLPATTSSHKEILDSGEIPDVLAPYFIPRIVRDGTTVRLIQLRFDEQQGRFCWQSLAQPLKSTTTAPVRPYLRLSCPDLISKFDYEAMLHFLRYHNTRPDGTYYVATPERLPVNTGYGYHDSYKTSDYAPPQERKLLLFFGTPNYLFCCTTYISTF